MYSTDFLEKKKTLKVSNITKIRPVGAELFHADGQADRHDEANARFTEFCERAQVCEQMGAESPAPSHRVR